jgi:hypothetical protein
MSNSGPGISFVGHRSYRPSVIELGIVTAAVSIAVCAAFPGAVLAVVLGIIVLVLSALRVDALLYLAIFLLPIAPTLPSEMMILRDVSALLHLAMFAGVWLGYMIRGESVRTWLLGARLNYLIAAYVGIVTLSVLIPGHTTITAEKSLFRWVSYFCLYLAVTGWVKSKQQIKNILGILGASTLLVLVFGLHQALINGYGDLYFWLYPKQEDTLQPWVGRVPSFLGHFNLLAGYLNLVLPLAIGFSVVLADRMWKYSARLFLMVGIIVLILTQSRGGLIAFCGVMMLAIWYFGPTVKARLRLSVLLLVCVGLAFLSLTAYSERFSEVDDWTYFQRLAVYGSAWNMFTSSPILGVGFSNFRENYDPAMIGAEIGALDAHNLYLKSLAETGLLGAVTYFAMFGLIFRTAQLRFRSRRWLLDGILSFAVMGGLCSVLIHGFVDYVFDVSPQVAALFWVLIGVFMANENLQHFVPANLQGKPTG